MHVMIHQTKTIQFSLVNFVIAILITIFHQGILKYLFLHIDLIGNRSIGILTYTALYPAFAILLFVIVLVANAMIIKTKKLPDKIIGYSAIALFVPIAVYYIVWILKYFVGVL